MSGGIPDPGDGHPLDFWNPDLGPHGFRDGMSESGLYLPDDPLPFPHEPFPPTLIIDLHKNSDVDSSNLAQHHTLGPRHNQSSPGDHTHDGKTSAILSQITTLQNQMANLGQWTNYISNANAASNWFGSSINPAINNGTITGDYCLIGKLCTIKLRLIFGSTTTQGSGFWFFNLPFNSPNSSHDITGSVESYAGTALSGSIITNDATSFSFVNQGNASFWGPGNPATWGTGNGLNASITYRTV